MRHSIVILLLALIPTSLLLSSDYSRDQINGLWYDHYSQTKLEIKHTRKGIKVREHKRYRKKKWRTYYHMGRGVYDDCDGKAIIVLGYNRIKWRKSYGRSVQLSRDHYSDYRDDNRYERDYGTDRRRDDYGRGNRYYDESYYGDWYCADHGLNLSIEAYYGGFRAREPGGAWTYYNRYRDNEYRDRVGNWYAMDDDNLTWHSRDSKRKYKFKRK